MSASRNNGPTICHRLPPLVKLSAAVTVILTGLLIPADAWPVFGVLGCLVFTGHSIAAVPVRYLARRVLLFLPFVGLMSISLPLSQGFTRGWDLMLVILLRGLLAFLTSLWLIQVMPFPQLLKTLRRLRVPVVVIAILAFMERYIFVIWDELDTLRSAWRLRSFGSGSIWFRWKSLSQMLGMLLIRCLNRAEKIHWAMVARGWNGEMHWLDEGDPA